MLNLKFANMWRRSGIIMISLLAAQVLSQNAQGDAIFNAPSSPDFYKEEVGTFTCDFNGQIDNATVGFGIRFDSDPSQLMSCTPSAVPGAGKHVTTGSPTGGPYHLIGPDKLACEEAYTGPSGMLSFSTDIRSPGEYECVTWASSFSVVGPKLIVPALKVAPTSLEMKVEPQVIYIGKDIEITCTSEGGDPAANFTYGVGTSDESSPTPPQLQATKEDNNKSYWCRDTSHSNYKGGDTEVTYQSKPLIVYYFIGTTTGIVNRIVNPSEEIALQCSTERNLPGGVTITYKWEENGKLIQGEMEEILTVEKDSNGTDSSSWLYTCIANTNDSNLQAVTVTYNITFDEKASTPTPPTTTKELTIKPVTSTKSPGKPPPGSSKGGKSDPTITIIVVVVVVTVIILIVVIIIIVIKKRSNSQSAEVTKDAEQAKGSPPKGESEQENGEPDVTVKEEEEKKMLLSPENNKSTCKTSLNEELSTPS